MFYAVVLKARNQGPMAEGEQGRGSPESSRLRQVWCAEGCWASGGIRKRRKNAPRWWVRSSQCASNHACQQNALYLFVLTRGKTVKEVGRETQSAFRLCYIFSAGRRRRDVHKPRRLQQTRCPGAPPYACLQQRGALLLMPVAQPVFASENPGPVLSEV